jgi:hypothetical protein
LPTHFTLFDSDCRRVDEFSPREEWFIKDESADRHLMVVEKPMGAAPRFSAEPPEPRETLIVDSIDKGVVSRWRGASAPYGRFADYGKALCNAFGKENSPNSSVRCWNVDDGKVISDTPGDLGGAPFATASRSSRVIYSEHRYSPGLIRDWDTHSVGTAEIWDFRARKILASWTPGLQAYSLLFARGSSKPLSEPARFAISSDGQYVAEGGNGIMRLYRIEP